MGKKDRMVNNMAAMGEAGVDNWVHAALLCWPIFQLGGPREFDRNKMDCPSPWVAQESLQTLQELI